MPNAIERLRAMGADFQDILSGPEIDRWMADVADVDALYQAAKEEQEAVKAILGTLNYYIGPNARTAVSTESRKSYERVRDANAAVAAAVRRVDGDA